MKILSFSMSNRFYGERRVLYPPKSNLNMTAVFYKNESVKNKINKVLSNNTEITLNFLDNENVLSPYILLNRKLNDNLNYVYISSLSRYYFIEHSEILNSNLFAYFLSVDVLMSYKPQILSNKAKIIQSSNVLNFKKTDYVESENVETIKEFDFPKNPFTVNSDVLVCVKG